MKRALLGLLLCINLSDHSETLSGGKVRLETIEAEGEFAVAVMVPPHTSEDRAIVTYQFWHTDPKFGRLLLTRSVVIEPMGGVFVMAEGVETSRKNIKSIVVTLAQATEIERFEMTGKP